MTDSWGYKIGYPTAPRPRFGIASVLVLLVAIAGACNSEEGAATTGHLVSLSANEVCIGAPPPEGGQATTCFSLDAHSFVEDGIETGDLVEVRRDADDPDRAISVELIDEPDS